MSDTLVHLSLRSILIVFCRIEEYCTDDGASITAGETLSYLSRVLYNRRNKFNPLWNDLIVAGMEGGKP